MTSKVAPKPRIGRPPSGRATARHGLVRIISYVTPADAAKVREACDAHGITRGDVLAIGAKMASSLTPKRCKRCDSTANMSDPHVNADGTMFCTECVDEIQNGDYLGQGGRS